MGTFRSALYGVLTIALGACQDPLVVANSNNPDRGRVFNSAADLEQFIASGYARAHAGTLGAATVLTGGSNDALQPQLLVMGMENVSALANFAMGPRSAIPRNPITNARGSQGNIGNYRDWVVQHSAALPANWINGQAALPSGATGSFVQLARSYKARFRAGVARTPAERADVSQGGIVDWSAVIGDANAGIKLDFSIFMDPTNGWDVAWVIQHYATGSASWHQMSQFWLGMADTSGGYNVWLSQPGANRGPFTVVTPDRPVPPGATRGPPSAVPTPAPLHAPPASRNDPA